VPRDYKLGLYMCNVFSKSCTYQNCLNFLHPGVCGHAGGSVQPMTRAVDGKAIESNLHRLFRPQTHVATISGRPAMKASFLLSPSLLSTLIALRKVFWKELKCVIVFTITM
jgi:hypothetical protein